MSFNQTALPSAQMLIREILSSVTDPNKNLRLKALAF